MVRGDIATSLLDALKDEGHRMTNLRRAFIELLTKHRAPLTVQEIMEFLDRKKIRVNKTSVYREIEFLLDKKIIVELDLLDGKKRYEFRAEDDHHHHLICTHCKNILCVEIPNDLDSIERKLRASYKFKVTSHVLEFFGLCQKCQ